MARYIEVSNVVKSLLSVSITDDLYGMGIKTGIDEALKIIEKAHTADVAEVRHGEWIKTERGIRVNVNTGQPMRVYHCECSCCGWHTGHQGIEFNYCPNCGEKKVGGKSNESI